MSWIKQTEQIVIPRLAELLHMHASKKEYLLVHLYKITPEGPDEVPMLVPFMQLQFLPDLYFPDHQFCAI